MTIENVLNLFEYHNLLKIQLDEGEVKLILQIDDFKNFYSLIDTYIIDNEIYLKVLSETWFSLNITDILIFYEIDKNNLISKLNLNK